LRAIVFIRCLRNTENAVKRIPRVNGDVNSESMKKSEAFYHGLVTANKILENRSVYSNYPVGMRGINVIFDRCSCLKKAIFIGHIVRYGMLSAR